MPTIVQYTDTNIPTASEVRNRWCFGLPLIKDDGSTLTDPDISAFIMEAVKSMERRLGIYLKPTVIACNPEERGLVKGTDYEVYEPPYDYDSKSWMNYGFTQLRQRPLRSVEGYKLVLPNGLVIMDFMQRPQWLKIYPEPGQIHIVPYAGDPTLFALLGGSSSGYPFVTGSINGNMPSMIYIDYTAGYELGDIPEDVRNMVARMATIEILSLSATALFSGVQSASTSIDGLSESVSNAMYTDRITQLSQKVEEFFDPAKGGARSSERGITMFGL